MCQIQRIVCSDLELKFECKAGIVIVVQWHWFRELLIEWYVFRIVSHVYQKLFVNNRGKLLHVAKEQWSQPTFCVHYKLTLHVHESTSDSRFVFTVIFSVIIDSHTAFNCIAEQTSFGADSKLPWEEKLPKVVYSHCP